jgi:uncharacterized protein (TIGR04222 family)
VHRPTASEKTWGVIRSNMLLLVPLLVFFGMLHLWRRFGRDPDPGSIFVRYEPPPGLTPAEAGTLMDDQPDLRDITATIVDLAVRGFIEIAETEQSELFGLLKSRDYQLTLLRRSEWNSLKAHESTLLRALDKYATGDTLEISELRNRFYQDIPEIRKHLRSVLVDGGYYSRSPDTVRALWFLAAVAFAIVVVIAGLQWQARFGMANAAVFIAAGLSFLIICIFGFLMPRRTAEGARTHAWLRGFEEFLARVDKDRLERTIESPALFEKYLPYAMAFGVESNWAKAFEGIATELPDWYRGAPGHGHFVPHVFMSDLGRMTSSAGSAMTTAPRSSSSSGSSGFSGGSSGGGFGGGGGGGF